MVLETRSEPALLSTYDAVAHEYFDRARHPTCFNLRWATRVRLEEFLAQVAGSRHAILEVGAGDSLVAEVLSQDGHLERLSITDVTAAMLAYSEKWRDDGATLSRQDARQLELDDQSMSVIVSSLGDPYNEERFWKELRRVLAPGGSIFFSTPSFEWAQGFRSRSGSPLHAAEFARSDGTVVYLPSFIYSVAEQVRLINGAGLTVTKVLHTSLDELPAEGRSRKLTEVLQAVDPVVTIFVARRNDDENI
jgi:ubiquinone/menaquinone biosynthesis C-methylase UbiE